MTTDNTTDDPYLLMPLSAHGELLALCAHIALHRKDGSGAFDMTHERLATALQQANEKLAAFRKYADHKVICSIKLMDGSECTCGLEGLLRD